MKTYKLPHIHEHQKMKISETTRDRLLFSTTALEAIIHRLINGDINFTEFKFLADNRERVLTLCDVSDDLTSKKTIVEDAFNSRHKEQEAFMAFHNSLFDLWTYSKKAVKYGQFRC